MSKLSLKKNSKGFSTLEILIAMAVLISSFTAVVLLSSAASLSTDSQIASEALSSVRKELENQQSLARKDFKLVVATSSPMGISGVQSTTTVDVVQLDNFTKKITATVSWKGTFNRIQNISLSALVTNFGNAVGGDTCSSVLTGNWKTPTAVNSTFASVVGDSNANAPYPITDIDAYQKRLYVVVSTTSSAVGPQSPNSANITSDSTFGTLSWSNPDRAATSNGSYATRAMSGTNSTHYLKATNFGFSIPPGATILGIKVDIEKSRTGGFFGEVRDSRLRIVKNGAIGTTDKAATGTNWPTSDTYSSYGTGTTDMWGETWTVADINSANFGVAFSAVGSTGSTNRTANIDHVRITVYYTKQFYILNLATPGSPTFISGLATSTLSTGLNAIAVATSSIGSYAYVTTNSTSGTNQLQVIDINDITKPYVRATFPGVSGTGMGAGIGNSIFYKDGYAYVGLTHVGTGPEFNIIDVSTPSVPIWKGGYVVGTTTNSIFVKDGYAYVTTNDTTRELVILNITNPASPTLAGTYNATPDVANFGYGRALYTVGDTVYMGRSWTNSGSIPQFLSLNASTMTPSLVNSKTLGTNFTLRDIVVRDYLAFLLTGSGTSGGQLQIISATSTASWGAGVVTLPTGGAGVGGVSLDCEGNYMYAASVDSTNRGYITSVTGN